MLKSEDVHEVVLHLLLELPVVDAIQVRWLSSSCSSLLGCWDPGGWLTLLSTEQLPYKTIVANKDVDLFTLEALLFNKMLNSEFKNKSNSCWLAEKL